MMPESRTVSCLKKLKHYKGVSYLLHLKDLEKFNLTSIVKKQIVYLVEEKF